MDDEAKFYTTLSLILFALSGLLILKFLLIVVVWEISGSNIIVDYLGLLWPFIGICTALEFLRSPRDKWGWGGFLFHFFILYCAISYLIISIQNILGFIIQIEFVLVFIIQLTLSVLGWLGFLYYYD